MLATKPKVQYQFMNNQYEFYPTVEESKAIQGLWENRGSGVISIGDLSYWIRPLQYLSNVNTYQAEIRRFA